MVPCTIPEHYDPEHYDPEHYDPEHYDPDTTTPTLQPENNMSSEIVIPAKTKMVRDTDGTWRPAHRGEQHHGELTHAVIATHDPDIVLIKTQPPPIPTTEPHWVGFD